VEWSGVEWSGVEWSGVERVGLDWDDRPRVEDSPSAAEWNGS
jgi:hypothetical protein